MISYEELKHKGAQFDFAADRKLRAARQAIDGEQVLELRRKRGSRRRDRYELAMNLWAGTLLVVCAALCTAQVRLVHIERQQAQTIQEMQVQTLHQSLSLQAQRGVK